MKDIYPIPANFKTAKMNAKKYDEMYAQSVRDPEGFWGEQAERLDWFASWDKVKNTKFGKDSVQIKWFEGGELNVAYNCLDRHLATRGDKIAIIWEGDNPADSRKITYRELHVEVCKFAIVLESQGVQHGDRVTIYMPMIPEAAVAMLACARIGATHSVVFGGFSPEAIAGRIEDCKSEIIITATEGNRGGKKVPLLANVEAALTKTEQKIRQIIVVGRNYEELMAGASAEHTAQAFDAENPLFLLYTSGSTGKPKGVLHTSAGYLLYASMTHEYVFDLREDDVYWCTADIGWVTGHSYIIYGPLANGETTLMFEGVPTYPDASRFWQVIDKHKVTQFYTAPTAIRALMAQGNSFTETTSRDSLRILGSVGEPINPEAWRWYYEVIGKSNCPIMDTWWQTETGGFMITPLPAATPLKAGSATKPFFGIQPVILNNEGDELTGEAEGILCFRDSWPGQMRGLYGDQQRFFETYFSQYKGYYMCGDGAKRDADGYFWITGRIDDVINVSGHRMGTAEVESALVLHKDVAEAAVVGFPHDIKGQGIYAYVILNNGVQPSDALKAELVKLVRAEIGPIAAPDIIHFTSGVPKTRSGKIMRRILRKIAAGETDNLGDTSTLLNPEIVDELLGN